MLIMAAPIIQPLIVFAYYLWQGQELDAATAFTTLALFNLLRFPFAFLPMAIQMWIQTLVGMKRLQEILMQPSVASMREVGCTDMGDTAISIQGAFLWSSSSKEDSQDDKSKKEVKGETESKEDLPQDPQESKDPVDGLENTQNKEESVVLAAEKSVFSLAELHLEIPQGSLVAVVGMVGAGKSSLLHTILGNTRAKNAASKVRLNGSTCYVPQRAWVKNETVRENIVSFSGQDYDEEWYNTVVYSCALKPDFDQFEFGDQTEIGERGITLSGGQKARISLARAIYQRKEDSILLLDDIM